MTRPARPARPRHDGDAAFIWVVAGVAGVGAWVWATGQLAGWVNAGRRPEVAAAHIGSVVVRIPGHLSDPRLAWPASARSLLPGPAALYGCAAAVLVPVIAAGLLLRRSDPGTRRGSGWASNRDLRSVRVRQPGRPGRVALGRIRRWRPGGLVATESSHSVLVIGPTQSGKTTGLAIPALLEWRGPLIATSVKDDLAAATLDWRRRCGPCWVFDPTCTSGLQPLARWSPLAACRGWSDAQRMAGWLVDATPARTGMADAAFWYAAAAKQLAPLLLAAELGGWPMSQVVRWTDSGDFDEPLHMLELSGEADAALALTACAGRDDRIRSSVGTTLETVLSPFEDPAVAGSTSGSDIAIHDLLDSNGSLYLCGPSHEQHRVQGLFAALVSAVVAQAIGVVNSSGQRLDPPLLLVLDEAANIAPVRDLDTLASTGAGFGIQIVTVCQDLAQLAARYGSERSRTIANNHRAKVLLSGVSDMSTLDLISGLAGEQALREETMTHDLRDGRKTRSSATVFRRLAPADELRRIPPGDAVLVYGHLPPVRLRLRPWFLDRAMKRRARLRPAALP